MVYCARVELGAAHSSQGSGALTGLTGPGQLPAGGVTERAVPDLQACLEGSGWPYKTGMQCQARFLNKTKNRWGS